MCFVEPGGERTMVTLPGIERHFERAWFDRVEAARFGCGFASGYEVEGPGGDAIIAFFEDHPSIQFYYAPGPRVSGVGAQKTARINALHPVWHLNDQEALAYTGCATVDEAGAAIAEECGNAVVITAGKDGAHLFVDGRHAVISPGLWMWWTPSARGDAHLGALTAARAAGRSWEDALALANRVAGAVCGVRGATLPDDVFAQRGIRLWHGRRRASRQPVRADRLLQGVGCHLRGASCRSIEAAVSRSGARGVVVAHGVVVRVRGAAVRVREADAVPPSAARPARGGHVPRRG